MNPFLLFIVATILISFYVHCLVEWLNLRHCQNSQLPEEFARECDAEKFQAAQNYTATNAKYSILKSVINTPVSLAFLLLGGFGALDRLALRPGFGEIASGLLFFTLLMLIAGMYELPFSLYETFVLEAHFGFNKTTIKTFIMDRLKGGFLAVVLGGPIVSAVLWFFLHFQGRAWILAWGFLAVVQFVLMLVAPTWIMPLFNKFSPMQEGDLRNAINKYAVEQNFSLSGIFTMDGSKRSSKANAFFTGFGKFRRIVLFDTLIEKQSTAELVAVLAHEVGHAKRKHTLKFLLLSLLSSFVMFYVFSLFLRNDLLLVAFGFEHSSIYASLFCVAFLYSPISALRSLITNSISRRFEFEADQYAVVSTRNAGALISALKKLSVENLSNLNPHPLKVFLEYSHPPVVQRIRAMTRFAQN